MDAPYIKEFPLVLECKLTHTVEIGLHTQFIGEILDVKVEDSVLGEGGTIDIEKMRPFLIRTRNPRLLWDWQVPWQGILHRQTNLRFRNFNLVGVIHELPLHANRNSCRLPNVMRDLFAEQIALLV